MKLNLSKYDRICFLGDSITAEGTWIKEVTQWFLDNLPELEIGLYNCGISGARGSEMNLKNRFVSDCLRYFPKYVVIMYGMNDIEVFSHNSDNPADKRAVERGISLYPEMLRYYIEECKKIGATPIICSPTPYNEYTETPAENFVGSDQDLMILAGIAEQIAKENGLLFIDMRQALFSRLAENPIREDRMHPNAYGNHLMAEAFLCAIGAKETPEPDKECVVSPKNEKRYEKEQILRDIMYIERLWQGEENIKSVAERKEIARNYCGKQKDPLFEKIGQHYVEYADYKDELRGEIVKLTLEMYQ